MSFGPARSDLLTRGLQLNFDGKKTIAIPGIAAAAANVGFVAQGAVVPMLQLSIDALTLELRKLMVVIPFTNELLQHSIPNLEAVMQTVLTESVLLARDAALLDSSAGDSVRPAGLRNGINALSESANAGDLNEAMVEDLDTIISSVATVASNSPIVVVASPSRARRMRLRLRLFTNNPGFEILSSAAVAAAEVVAIATNCLVSATDPVPSFDSSIDANVVMDTSAGDIVSGGNPTAGTAASLFQRDIIALRLRFGVSWGLRTAAGLAWVEDVIW
jgi:Phage capsid family